VVGVVVVVAFSGPVVEYGDKGDRPVGDPTMGQTEPPMRKD